MDNSTKIILERMITDLTLLVQRIMISAGVRPDSDLIKSIEFIPTDSGLQLLANDYYQYLSTGRKPKARKVPIENLISWIKKYKIGSGDINNLAWAIQQGIYKNGIKGKAYADLVSDSVAELSSEQLSTVLSELLLEDMVMAFDPLTKNNS